MDQSQNVLKTRDWLRKFSKNKLYFVTSVLAILYCYYRDEVINRPLSKHFFQRTQQHGGWKSPKNNDKLLWKTVSSSYYIEHSSKQIIAVTYTLDERFAAATTFNYI